jgi:glutathione S-transferase
MTVILMHHLRVGRPIFTVWLMEELGLDYELKTYDRNPETRRAPPELRQVHPLGKSPVIEDGGLKLAESGAITSYLIDRYDTEGNLAPPRSDVSARATYGQWLHYSEGSAFAPLLLKLLLLAEQEPMPPVISGFADGEVPLHLTYIQEFLGDKPFLLGDHLQGPDFGMGYIVQLAQRVGALDGYSVLDGYLGRLTARPAFQRAIERAGE